jgi:hypothetical protein
MLCSVSNPIQRYMAATCRYKTNVIERITSSINQHWQKKNAAKRIGGPVT